MKLDRSVCPRTSLICVKRKENSLLTYLVSVRRKFLQFIQSCDFFLTATVYLFGLSFRSRFSPFRSPNIFVRRSQFFFCSSSSFFPSVPRSLPWINSARIHTTWMARTVKTLHWQTSQDETTHREMFPNGNGPSSRRTRFSPSARYTCAVRPRRWISLLTIWINAGRYDQSKLDSC